MAGEKAKKIETFYGKHFTAIVYEYRGHEYEVTYPRGWMVCCTPAWVQHRDEQAKIDALIDNPPSEKKPMKSFDEQLDEIWNMLGWD